MRFTEQQQQLLLEAARASIRHGLDHGKPPEPPVSHEAALLKPGASFVTLEINDRLRGCIGSLQPRRPLIEDVSANAWSAAFRDPRFAPLQDSETSGLRLSVSVLGPEEVLAARSRAGLLQQLRPGLDGLILEDGRHRATFLPAVWDSLPTADSFVSELMLKAGLPADHWSDTLKAWRYTTESVSAPFSAP